MFDINREIELIPYSGSRAMKRVYDGTLAVLELVSFNVGFGY
jgi:hypothetical protein